MQSILVQPVQFIIYSQILIRRHVIGAFNSFFKKTVNKDVDWTGGMMAGSCQMNFPLNGGHFLTRDY
jgi:hypothetical protein